MFLTAGTNRYSLETDKNICILGVGPGEAGKSDILKQALSFFVPDTNSWMTQEQSDKASA